MKIFRFMSMKEFNDYNDGEDLFNHKDHSEDAATDSVGFCFFSLDDIEPEEAIHHLSGIVDMEVCAVFEVDERLLKKGYGKYASRISETGDFWEDLLRLLAGFSDTVTYPEYSTVHYNKYFYKLEKFCTNISSEWFKSFENKDKKFDWEVVNERT